MVVWVWQLISIVGFFFKYFCRSIHSERRTIYLGKLIQALQNDTIIIMIIQFQGHPANSTVAYLKNFYVCFRLFLFISKTFRGSWLLKYLFKTELMTFSHKIQAKTFTWPNMSFYARYVTLIRQIMESNKRVPGRVVIYTSVHLELTYT